jgi:hypothetical protein
VPMDSMPSILTSSFQAPGAGSKTPRQRRRQHHPVEPT